MGTDVQKPSSPPRPGGMSEPDSWRRPDQPDAGREKTRIRPSTGRPCTLVVGDAATTVAPDTAVGPPKNSYWKPWAGLSWARGAGGALATWVKQATARQARRQVITLTL